MRLTMSRRWITRLLIGVLAALLLVPAGAAQDEARRVYALTLEGPLTPTLVAYVERGIETAAPDRAEGLILALDTPGGRSDHMQQLVEAIRASPVPVVVYVSPRGAAAASAGTLITLAG